MADSKRQCYTFIPRSVAQKKTVNVKRLPKQNVNNLCASVALDGNVSSSTDEVKKTSIQQRWPAADEPRCVVCEKYGEYICNETDEDVCSLECKSKHLNGLKNESLNEPHSEPESSLKVETAAHQDESIGLLPQDFDLYYTEKVAYSPTKEVSSMTEEKIAMIREKLEIRTKGTHIPKLIFSFSKCSFSRELLENLENCGFASPTPVQMQVIPAIQCRADILVSACTNSGKTASFLLPIIHNIYSCLGNLHPSHEYCKFPIALIIVPTREIAIQIEDVSKAFSKSLNNLRTALLIGGLPIPPQLHRLKHKVQLVIGTPGRINDILQNHTDLQLQHIKMIVLDEVDVMLQMGFQNQIECIVEQIPTKAQYLMFSATIPSSIEELAAKMMTSPIFISIGPPGLPNKSIKQIVLWVEDASKRKKLFSIIGDPKHFLPPVLIFVDSKMGADMLSNAISLKFPLQCESLHSDKSQPERSKILHNFLDGVYDILVATNVIGRGIDFVNVRQVIIFDMPKSIEDYVHQLGRAGRLDSTGCVMSFINSSNKKIFLDLKELCEKSGNKLPDELIHSPYLSSEVGKKQREVRGKLQRQKARWNEEKVNPQNLLQILTKNR